MEIADLFPFLDEDEEEAADEHEEEEEDDETSDLTPYWSSAFIPNLFTPIFSSGRRSSFSSGRRSSFSSSSDPSDFPENHISLPNDVFDLTPPSPPIPPFHETLDSHNFRVLDAVDDYLDLDQDEDGAFGFAEAESSGGGLRIVGFGSESDSSEDERGIIGAADCDAGGGGLNQASGDLGLPLCWDFLRIDDVRRDPSEEFEWEEVDDRLDDRGVLSMMVGIDDGETSSGRGDVVNVELEPEEAGGEEEEDDLVDSGRNAVWEVLLAMNNHAMNRSNSATIIEHVDGLSDFGDDPEVFVNPSDYEFQIGQFADHDSVLRGSPPTAKLVVENLPSIVLTGEDVANNYLCAVCKDVFLLEERVKQLPCSHRYHKDCIFPWLGIRNTCPVCRYELPTDDPEYERSKVRMRLADAATPVESLLRSDFEIFPGV